MLDHYHGLGIHSWDSSKVWHRLAANAADKMNIALLKSLWPGGFYSNSGVRHEYKFMVNGPYGEIFDMLTDQASATAIDHYPVVLMSGEIRPDATLRTKLKNYVNAGGNLIVNSAMNIVDFGASFTGATLGTAANRSVPGLRWKIDASVKSFSAARTVSAQPMTLSHGASALLETTDSTPVTLASIRTHGQGRVIVVGLPNLQDQQFWGFLLEKLSENPAVNPFKVTGDIMHQVNYKGADTWLVTLTNNRGIGKHHLYRQSNPGGAHTVLVDLQEAGRAVSSVTEYPIFHGIWKTGSGAVAHANDRFVVSVGYGETRVFKVATRASGG